MARRFMPDMEIKDDEDLLALLEGLRNLGVSAHDEIDEWAGLIRAKIERYGRRNGLSRMRAKFWGRQVARPLVRAADQALNIAAYARVTRNRFEAFLIALDDEQPGKTDFTVKGRTTNGRRAA